MSLQDIPSSERIHIGFFGRRNVGKSSLVNAVTGQQLSIVSDTKGTTTDPVTKSMEILPLGPVVIIDTPGIDDEGALGEQRVKRTRQVLNRTDVAVLVADAAEGLTAPEEELLTLFREKNIEYVIAMNKADLLPQLPAAGDHRIWVSATQGTNVNELRLLLAGLAKEPAQKKRLVGDLIEPGEMLVLVMPQDVAAPKGRLILPQVQMIRDILDEHALALCVQTEELPAAMAALKERPGLVITDSQVFGAAAAGTPDGVLLTSFSILLARYKGLLSSAVRGVAAIDRLTPEDQVLIVEGCTHHRQCDDIGTVKIPRGLKKHLGFDVRFETCSGASFPEDLTPYRAVIHCGGCMLSEREVLYRVKCAEDQQVPITNYGILLAYLQGILPRALEIFPELRALIV